MMTARIPRCSRPAMALAVATLWVAACDDTRPPSEPDVSSPEEEAPSLSSLIVSNPVETATGPTAGLFLSESSSSDDIVFISLPPGTVPNGERVFIRARETGAEATTVMADGGFDPIPIAAMVGETLEVQIYLDDGEREEFVSEVPPKRPPIVVRTDPPPQRRDVPLNAVLLVVFSEPVDAATLTPSSVQLLLDGGVPVDGTVASGNDANLAATLATFAPAEPLLPEAEYTLRVTQEVEDLDGDALEAPATVEFETEPEVSAEPTEPSSPEGSISGVVRGVTTTGVSPLDGARVTFFEYYASGGRYLGDVFTDSEGRYSYSAGGPINVYASHPGFLKPCVNFGDGTQDIVLYSENAFLNDGVQPPSDASPMVSGVVYEDVDGALVPLPGITVYLDLLFGLGQVGATALTNSNGEYFLCRIPRGATAPVVQATGPGGDTFMSDEIAAEDQELDIVFGR